MTSKLNRNKHAATSTPPPIPSFPRHSGLPSCHSGEGRNPAFLLRSS